MFNLLHESGAWIESKRPRWATRLLQFACVLAVAGSIFGLLYLGVIMIE